MQIHECRRDAEAKLERDKPRQGVVANTRKLSRNRAVGFIVFHEKAFKLKMKFISLLC
jgi:hypothetical protein